jgi:hypothetical protein
MTHEKWNNEHNDKNDVVYYVIALYLQEEVNSKVTNIIKVCIQLSLAMLNFFISQS